MKRIMLFLVGVLMLLPTIVLAETNINKNGYLIKKEDSPAVYYVGTNNTKHLFPNEATFWSYYSGSWENLKIYDFVDYYNVSINTVSQLEFDNIKYGSNVTVKPGSRLIKFQNSNNIYIVFTDFNKRHNVLRKITSDDCLQFYGPNFKCSKKAILIQDGFTADYIFDNDDDDDDIVFMDGDNDGLASWDELDIYGSDESKRDTDGDGYPDGLEVLNNYDPIINDANLEKDNRAVMDAVDLAIVSLETKRAQGDLINDNVITSFFGNLDRTPYCAKSQWGFSYNSNYTNIFYSARLCGIENIVYCADSSGFRGVVSSTSWSGLCVETSIE